MKVAREFARMCCEEQLASPSLLHELFVYSCPLAGSLASNPFIPPKCVVFLAAVKDFWFCKWVVGILSALFHGSNCTPR